MLKIVSISAENLRGYNTTTLNLKNLTVLVGENNEGKSSILKMFEHLMKMESEFWVGNQVLSDKDYEFWYPANDARHQARRFTINIEFLDGRVARPYRIYGAKVSEPFQLRFAVDSLANYRLNVGAPKRNEKHDLQAVKLLEEIKRHVQVVLLPPVREAKSSTFAEKVTQTVKDELYKNMGHNKQAGAPKEYRLAKEVIDKIQEIVSLHSGELARSNDSPLASMLKASEVRVELFPKDIYELIAKSMFVYLSTGSHDELKVLPNEVGNGLQSLIDINLTIELILSDKSIKNLVVIIEEPEAFLHPSAQRQFMQFLRRALVNKVQSAILTTHSPVILDEAKYDEIVLVRNQKHFAPMAVASDRASINTSLMTTSSSEVFFARTVILLEGEGDKAFFNTLIRRIKNKATVCPELAGLVFQVVGGCKFYAPWLKLTCSYRRSGEDPFNTLWIMDGDAASTETNRAVIELATNCELNLQEKEKAAITAFGDLDWEITKRKLGSNHHANYALQKYGGYLFCCDFEWALFNGSNKKATNSIKKALSMANVSTLGDNVELARRLGSKIKTGKSSSGSQKYPFIRTLIAENLDFSNMPPEIYDALKRILLACYKSPPKVNELLKKCEIDVS